MEATGEERLLEFLYACPVGLVECDAAGTIAVVNPHAMQHLFPLAGERNIDNLFSILERHAPEIRTMIADHPRDTGRVCDGHRITVDLGDGRAASVPTVLACSVVKLGRDRLMATIADISAQVAQEQRLRQADAWFSTLLDRINDYAVVTLSSAGIVLTANEAFAQQTGRSCADIMGHDLGDILRCEGGVDPAALHDQLVVAARDGWHLLEGWQCRASGERYWCQRLVVARQDIEGAGPDGFSVVLRDVPRRGAATEDLRRLLTCDHLTGAANRMYFRQCLDRVRERWDCTVRGAALVMVDLDHFKRVNDAHGHPVGDELLCAVAKACMALMPGGATFARLGGEEFAALLPDQDGDAAEMLAEAMRQAIADIVVPVAGGIVKATASLGCATLAEAGGNVDRLIALADERLYAAKHEGRDRVCGVRALAA
jgi:diguanylate cyclase (GGDEF)-like protein/PAS domain S-box-containing protein